MLTKNNKNILKTTILLLALLGSFTTFQQTQVREVASDKNMVILEEKASIRTKDYEILVSAPKTAVISPINMEVDPETEISELNMKADLKRVKLELKMQEKVKRSLVQREKELKETNTEAREKAQMLDSKIISLTDMIKKYSNHVKSDKQDPKREELVAKVQKAEKEVKKLAAEKIRVEKIKEDTKIAIEKAKFEIQKIDSKKQEISDVSPEVKYNKAKAHLSKVTQAIIDKKEVIEKEVESMKSVADKIEQKLKRETSPVLREELKNKQNEVKSKITSMEGKVIKMTKEVKKN